MVTCLCARLLVKHSSAVGSSMYQCLCCPLTVGTCLCPCSQALAEQQRAQLAQQQQAGAPQAQAAPGQAQAPTAGQAQAPGVPQAAAVAGAAAVPNAAVLVRVKTPSPPVCFRNDYPKYRKDSFD